MPRGDRRGPDGYGPMTGRGLGYCNGYESPGYVHGFAPSGGGRGPGRGFAYGRGFGRGFGRGAGYGPGYGPYLHYRNTVPEDRGRGELNYLEDTARMLEEELKDVQKRINELKDKDE